MVRRTRTCRFYQKRYQKGKLCLLSTFCCGEDLFQHVMHENGYGSMVHLGLIHYLLILYEEEIKPPKNCKRVSIYHNIQLDITNCYTFYLKGKMLITIFYPTEKKLNNVLL